MYPSQLRPYFLPLLLHYSPLLLHYFDTTTSSLIPRYFFLSTSLHPHYFLPTSILLLGQNSGRTPDLLPYSGSYFWNYPGSLLGVTPRYFPAYIQGHPCF